jgi:hypothetical protein
MKKLKLENFRGRTGEWEFGADKVALHGRNATGKTSILQAITFAALGHIPSMGSSPAARSELMGYGKDASVRWTNGDTEIVRTLTATEKSCSMKTSLRVNGKAYIDKVADAMLADIGPSVLSLDFGELMRLKGEERKQALFGLVGLESGENDRFGAVEAELKHPSMRAEVKKLSDLRDADALLEAARAVVNAARKAEAEEQKARSTMIAATSDADLEAAQALPQIEEELKAARTALSDMESAAGRTIATARKRAELSAKCEALRLRLAAAPEIDALVARLTAELEAAEKAAKEASEAWTEGQAVALERERLTRELRDALTAKEALAERGKAGALFVQSLLAGEDPLCPLSRQACVAGGKTEEERKAMAEQVKSGLLPVRAEFTAAKEKVARTEADIARLAGIKAPEPPTAANARVAKLRFDLGDVRARQQAMVPDAQRLAELEADLASMPESDDAQVLELQIAGKRSAMAVLEDRRDAGLRARARVEAARMAPKDYAVETLANEAKRAQKASDKWQKDHLSPFLGAVGESLSALGVEGKPYLELSPSKMSIGLERPEGRVSLACLSGAEFALFAWSVLAAASVGPKVILAEIDDLDPVTRKKAMDWLSMRQCLVAVATCHDVPTRDGWQIVELGGAS